MNYKYKIGDIISESNRDLEIIGVEIRPKYVSYKGYLPYTRNEKWYKYRCLRCGNEDWIVESSLFHCKTGCNSCGLSPKSVIAGVNDIATVAPEIGKLFQNPDDAMKYRPQSGKRVNFKCPDCGNIKTLRIQDVYRAGHLPCHCNDGVSYPNKFMFSLLQQIKVHFTPEMIFDWSEKRKYDFYIELEDKNIIVEQHGRQHYDSPIVKSGSYRTVKEEQENDRFKRELAVKNNVENYFEIDCRKSELNYIKKNIVNSGLLESLHVNSNDIDWRECHEFALSNLIKEVCEYQRNNRGLTQKQIGDVFGIHYKTVGKYLKTGNELGFCDYGEKDKHSHVNAVAHNKKRPVFCESSGISYASCVDASKHMSNNNFVMRRSNISNSAINNIPYKGYVFRFISQKEFNKVKSESPELAFGDFFNIKENTA